MGAWEARAEYADGTTVERIIPVTEFNPHSTDSEQQYAIEEWLLTYRDGCTWYSVNWRDDDEA